jgi:hypothetical protein
MDTVFIIIGIIILLIISIPVLRAGWWFCELKFGRGKKAIADMEELRNIILDARMMARNKLHAERNPFIKKGMRNTLGYELEEFITGERRGTEITARLRG